MKLEISSACLLLAVLSLAFLAGPAVNEVQAGDQDRYRYLIEFEEPGLIDHPTRNSGRPIDINGHGVRAYRDRLIRQQAQHQQSIGHVLGRTPEVSHVYVATHSGMAMWLSSEEAMAVRSLPGVVTVKREQVFELSTYRGPWFIGAETIWDGSGTPDGSSLMGEGMILAILDSGIDPDHPSFANDSACGHGTGDVPDKLLSYVDCDSTDDLGVCNGVDPEDNHGHGSHVASTAGGNRLGGDTMPVPEPPAPYADVSGVAPCAHIRSYKACPTNQCPEANILAGMNNVLLDGDVHVMNFSISGGQSPWEDNDRHKLDLVDAGILVSASAGNTGLDGQTIGRVNHRAPWVMTVAASTHDNFAHGIFSVSGPGVPPDELVGIEARKGTDSPALSEVTEFPVRYFDSQPENFEGCTPGEDGAPTDMMPFPEDFFSGSAALILRGECTFATQISNAYNAGAELVIIRGNVPGNFWMLTTGQAEVPAYNIPQLGGRDALYDFVIAHPDDAVIDFSPISGDVLASFSLRGPTPSPLQHLTKPDITAPGLNIYAAVPGGYNYMNGTSMSSPYVAGAAALVRQARPDWTVSEVRSALMSTAERQGRKDGVIGPLTGSWDADDVGSGRVDLARAALAGLVMDEVFDNYLAADPAADGDVRFLNLPSVRDVECTPDCIWTRTVRNTLDVPSSWEISTETLTPGFEIHVQPESFTFGGGLSETREIMITAVPHENLSTEVAFGEVIFSESAGLAPDQHITVAIRTNYPTIGVSPSGFDVTLEEGLAVSESLVVSNLVLAAEALEWSVEQSGAGCEIPDWLSVTPQEGAPTGGDSDQVELYFDTKNLSTGEYDADLCITSNDPGTPLLTVPVALTVVPPQPFAVIAPEWLEFDVVAGEQDGKDLHVENTGGATGAGELVWSVASDITALEEKDISWIPALDIPVHIPDFSLTQLASGGEPVRFTVTTDASHPVRIVGFSFIGTASGLTGSSNRAPFTCMVVESPDGRVYGIGGMDGAIEHCGNQNPWGFKGVHQGLYDDTYESTQPIYSPPVIEHYADEWTFTFVHDFMQELIPPLPSIHWSDVQIIFHLEAHPAMTDLPVDIADFAIVSPANGGAPATFTFESGAVNSADISGFSFSGHASGINDADVWASDTCMLLQSPDGQVFGVGGLNATVEGCGNQNPWDFQGAESSGDGAYESRHIDIFNPAVKDHSGKWTASFIHDLDLPGAADINWSDVTITLHNVSPLPACVDPADVSWLDVNPENGVMLAGEAVPVRVAVDSAQLAPGTHFAALCLNTNELGRELIVIPVRVTVAVSQDTIFSDRFE